MADGEKRIKELEEITALTSNDYFVVDSSASGGKTKKYKATNITDIINNIPELVAEFEPNHYYDRDALVAHEGKVYYHNAPGASYEEFPTGYQFIQIDLTGLLSRLGFGISIQHNSSFTYNKGDYCMEDYILYRCLNDNVTGAWSSSDWERASLGYDLSSIYKPRLDEHDEQIEESLALGTASGSIASFTDGSTLPMKKLEVDIEPVQDLHGYDNPWVGGSGKNKCSQKITEFSFSNNAGGSSSVQDDILVITTTSSANSGVYSILEFVGSFTGKCSYSVDVKANTNGNVLIGMTNAGRKTVSLTTNWQRIKFEDVTFDGSSKTFVVYSQGTANTIQLKDFMFETGSTAHDYEPYSNICPISGWDEVNVNRAKVYQICEPSDSTEITANGVTMTYLGKGKYRVKGTLTTNEYTSLNLPIVPFTIYGGEDCYIKLNNSVGLGAVSIIFKNNSSQVDSWGLYPSNRSGSYVGMRNKYTNNIAIEISSSGYGTNFDFTFKVEILSNSTANLSTYNISFGSAGTVYGGTLDVVSGVLTVDRVAFTMDGSVGEFNATGNRFIVHPTNENIPKAISNFDGINCICDRFASITNRQGASTTLGVYANSNVLAICNYKESLSDYQTWLSSNNVTIVYYIETPQTIQLTPTEVKSLLATNNVFADTGDILDATYVRNANITINDLIRRIEALEG